MAALVSVVAVGAVALGVSVAVVTAVIGVLAIAGAIYALVDIGLAAARGDWDTVAYDFGGFVGGALFGGTGGGRILAGMDGVASRAAPQRSWSDVKAYEQKNAWVPGMGSIAEWLSTKPTPASGAGSEAFISAGAAVEGDRLPWRHP